MGAARRASTGTRRAPARARRAIWGVAAALASACGTTAPLAVLPRADGAQAPLRAQATGGLPPPAVVRLPPPPTPTPAPTPTPTPAPVDCATAALASLTEAERVGQLLMVGVPSGDPRATGALAAIRGLHAGGVVLFGGGWSSGARVSATTALVQGVARSAERIGLLVAGNQEGGRPGAFQAFYGPGFSAIPPAPVQGGMDVGALTAAARTWGVQLAAAGVDVDLAPVVDTVPPGGDAGSGAVGALGRELGHDPSTVAAHGAAIVRGLRSGGIAVAVKHFPGLGRVPGNTDDSATQITDTATGPDDPYLAPFGAAISAGADLVMVSTATYSSIDASAPAAFSRTVVSSLLRGRLGFGGVVISDDLGLARSVASVPAGDRAVRFLAAGGDVVLTVVPSQASTMEAAILARVSRDAGFRGEVDSAVLRVLHLKSALGLLPGCPR